MQNERLHGGDPNYSIQNAFGPVYSLLRKAELPTHSWPEMHSDPSQKENCSADLKAVNLTLSGHKVWRSLLCNNS